MIVLSNDDRKQLRQAILSAYPSYGELEVFVDDYLNENLVVIVENGPLSTVAFKLIRWAGAKGHTDELIMALYKDTKNPDIQSICGRVLQQHVELNTTDSPVNLLPLDLGQSTWDLDVSVEELQSFLPKRFSFEADVGDLQRGLELSQSVCKITFADRSPEECGTGVLIAKDLVLTNYHVFSHEVNADLEEIARQARFEFGYTSRPGQPVQLYKAVETDEIAAFSPIEQLDYVLLRLDSNEGQDITPVKYDVTAQLIPSSPLNILQHPEGEQMKVSLSNNGVVKTNEVRGLVLYVNAAKPGSSGSPCFNQDWQLVALHHKGLTTSFGSLREGILFSAIYQDIQTQSSSVLP